MANIILSNVTSPAIDYTNFLETIFENFLIGQHISAITRKNYRSDLRNFFNWIIEAIRGTDTKLPDTLEKLTARITTEHLENYKHELLLDKTPQATINRRLSSLRMLFRFAQTNGWITDNPMLFIRNITLTSAIEKSKQKLLANFKDSLTTENASETAIKDYVADVSEFLDWLSQESIALN